MRNRNGIFWGLFLLLSAAILVVSQMHLITYTFGFWTIIVTIMLVAVLIKSLVYFAIPGTVFSLAFLAILYAKPLGITALVPWTILGAALLISIGLSMIFRPLIARHRPWMNKKYYRGYSWHHGRNFNGNGDPDVKTVNDSDVDVYVKMGSSIRYVKSENFKEANIDVSMGDAKVYFENVTVEGTAVINVNASLGGIELYIPKTWNVVKELDNNMGGVSEVGFSDVTVDSPVVTIRGLVSLSGLKISYI
ncbi:LiaF transmembrane domain-containing protein [Companilactobacillus kimchiensis]|uniref:LiaF transmembrane domain-containing protein n=1 Tax=Companilactobacillus kimchiensis TaxID=993692 RepID=A0A0R2LAF3_9LACO|nr:hypothetical protein [Companilactobacillus kimchiensis]KRN98747.1 hypothetical protein IV57_GL000860 [Companilactobacillus kimchiensis]